MHAMNVAGAEVLVKQLIQRLGEQISPIVYCLDSIGELGHELQRNDVRVLCLNRTPGIDWRLGKRLADEIHQHQIEVIHAHQYTPFFYSALAKLRGARAKVLLTEHGRHFPDEVSTRRKLVNRFLLQSFADRSTACCSFSADALRENDGFQSVSVIRNGIDASDFVPRADSQTQVELRGALGLDQNLKYVACVARFHPVKNHELLLDAWKLVQRQEPNARLLLVGDGEQRERLEMKSKMLDIDSTVEFLGIRSDISEILRAIDVFVLASKSEASSLTILEAMASECPLVLTDVGGNCEHVDHNVEGLLVPGDAGSLAGAIVKLLDDPEKRRELGRSARRRVERDFSLANVVDSYFRIYQRLAK